jgi:hypothetical protein
MQSFWNLLTLRKKEASLPSDEDDETSIKPAKREIKEEGHYMKVDAINRKTSRVSKICDAVG